MKIYSIFILLIFSSFQVHADYCATGKIEGNICSGFIIESCKFVTVDAVKNDKGELFTVNKCYEKVSDYKESKSMCWIHTKSTGGGALSWAANAIAQPEFLHKNKSGEYEEIDVEYLVFKCTKK